MLLSGFAGLAYEGIFSFLHHGRQRTLHKAVKVLETKEDIKHNKIIYLEDSMVMYGIYNAETLEKWIDTAHPIHNIATPIEKQFMGEFGSAYSWYVNKQGIQHYAIYSLLYLRMVRENILKCMMIS